ncbi:MAG: formylglycine-generating enzyme family protein [Alphaproteobacteria bacterium]|nr:formylglycine-generating enzyme family protein [Alphaproteobacteria bacterium]
MAESAGALPVARSVTNEDRARKALEALPLLRQATGETAALWALEARARHLLADYRAADAAYRAWFRIADKDDPARGAMVAALAKARQQEPLFPPPFRDCDGCPEMVMVPAGSFQMGSNAGYGEEQPVHRVTIPTSFAVGKYEVTFAQWDACAASGGCGGYRPDDAGWGRGDRPVINVNWDDAQAYVAWLSEKAGQTYRLLSGAEWEYMARAGTTTAYWWGAEGPVCRAGATNGAKFDDDRACNDTGTEPVGTYAPNGFGVHDVHGNVWEWVADCWHEDYAGAPDDGSAWTKGGDCGRRVLRGGSWNNRPGYLRSALRSRYGADYRDNDIGFRVARTLSR